MAENAWLEQEAGAAPAEDTSWKELPLEEQVTSKLWKARAGGFETLASTFASESPDSSLWKTYGPQLSTWVKESNASALEKALEATHAYISHAPNAGDLVEGLLKNVILKGLGATRPAAKSTASALLLTAIEVSTPGPVIQALIEHGWYHKRPPIVQLSVSTVTDAVRAFGASTVTPKPILKALPGLFDSRDKGVRDNATALAAEVYRWIKDPIRPHLDKLRPAQLKDIEAAFEAVDPSPPIPERYLRSATGSAPNTPAAAASEAASAAAAASDVADLDLEVEKPAVDVLALATPAWFTSTADSSWTTRKGAFEKLLEAATRTGNVVPGDFGEIARTVKKITDKDTNVMVISGGVKLCAALARGAKESFTSSARIVLASFLAKGKEKKAVVSDALSDALDAFHDNCFTIGEVADDVISAIAHKVPKVRTDTAHWVHRSILKENPKQAQSALKPLLPVLVKAVDDAEPGVRESAIHILGALGNKCGAKSIAGALSKLDPKKAAKIKDYMASLPPPTGGAPAASSSAPVVSSGKAPATSSGPPSKKPPVKAGGPPKKSSAPPSPARPTSRRPPASPARRKAPAPSGTAMTTKKLPSASAEAFKNPADAADNGSMSPEAVAETAEALFPPGAGAKLTEKLWKDRVEGLEAIKAAIVGRDPPLTALEAEAVVTTLSKTPGWKDSNFKVMSAVFETCSASATASSAFPSRLAGMTIAGIVEKLADPKVKIAGGVAMTEFCTIVGPGYVFARLYKGLTGHKNPKIIAEGLTWMKTAISDFGISFIPIKPLVEFLRTTLEHTNAAVRTASVALLAHCYLYLGPSIRKFFTDFKQALLDVIDKGFAAVEGTSPPVPEKQVRGAAAPTAPDADDAQDGGAAAAGPAAAVDLDAMMPRTDISSSINSKLLTKLGASAWKDRQAALNDIEALVHDANDRIEPQFGDLFSALKARLSDSNGNLITTTLNLLGLLATAGGSGMDRHVRYIIPTVLTCASNQKKSVRDGATGALDAWAAQIGFEPLLPLVADALAKEKTTNGRQAILAWLGSSVEPLSSVPVPGLLPIIKPVLTSLQDKAPDVRRAAESILKGLAPATGREPWIKTMAKLPPGISKTIKPVVEAATGGASTSLTPSTSTTSISSAGPSSVRSSPARPSRSRSASSRTALKSLSLSKGSAASKSAASLSSAMSQADDNPAAVATGPPPSTIKPCLASIKETRCKKDKSRIKWILEEDPTPEFRQNLNDALKHWITNPLAAKLVSTNFKDHLTALTILASEVIPAHPQSIVGVLDLICKWFVLRLLEGNTSVTIKALEVLTSLAAVLQTQAYSFSEYEASLLIPVLISRAGDNKEPVRSAVRGVMVALAAHNVVTPRRVVQDIFATGLKSKNGRARAEVLIALLELISAHGTDTLPQGVGKAVKELSSFFASDKDTTVRTAAANVLVSLHGRVDETLFWKAVPEAHKPSLEARVASASNEPAVVKVRLRGSPSKSPRKGLAGSSSATSIPRMAGGTKAGSASSSTTNVSSTANLNDPFSLNFEAVDVPSPSAAASPVAMPRLEPTSLASAFAGSNTPKAPSSLPKAAPKTPSQLLVEQDSIPVSPAISAASTPSSKPPTSSSNTWIKVLCDAGSSDDDKVNVLKQVAAALAESEVLLLSEVSSLVPPMTVLVRTALAAKEGDKLVHERLCKYILNSLMQIFSVRSLAVVVPQSTLQSLVQELLLRLLDADLPKLADSEQLLRALNLLMLKILENSERTTAFGVLLHCLRLYPTPTEPLIASPLFTKLVLKCLLKLTRTLSATVDDLDLASLMRDLHLYLVSHPPDPAVPKSQAYQTVVTIIMEVVKLKGSEVRDHLFLIPVHTSPLILDLVEEMLALHHPDLLSPASKVVEKPASPLVATDTVAPGSDVGPGQAAGTGPNLKLDLSRAGPGAGGSNPATPELRLELVDIFKKIGAKTTTSEGISLLHGFIKRHPDVDLAPHLSKTSAFFRAYIERGLAALDEKENSPNGTYSPAFADVPQSPALTNGMKSPTSPPPRDLAASYMSKLRSLQSQVGLAPAGTSGSNKETTAPLTASAPSTDNNGRPAEAASTTTGAGSAPVAAEAVATEATAPPPQQPDPGLSDLKKRLAMIKQRGAAN